jgi:hypothetical protein
MSRFSLKSKTYSGEIIVEIDDEGYVSLFDCTKATLSKEQKEWNTCSQPLNMVIAKIMDSKNTETIEYVQEITFDDFWEKYNDKLRSSRKRTLLKWNKMTEAEQLRAFNYIRKYFNSIPNGIEKKYAETYLNAELWNN